ncbi:signal peptidase I [Helicobacter mustelae]|uniref:Signal peptidase I n=1 Tax=Helicobacter mustelae (strain ATCC 43772 / CCUG 25715 / CIP 103759 / LMG 18044 / NCTC 12198 / R85-136P) TaxID=679897 RepID=D3UHD2_HELM1|nr:signal peptidase I [Helicobacter mustelae]CBG39904.1 signal peptidase I [Helicobacter mustelae 12198]SQH71415.1 signal peptidase I [Helicobacter mustelae]STP12543.1 signal peptidase I [Helicobacter mustelae]
MKNFFSKLSAFSSSWIGTIIIVLFVIFFIAQAFVIPSRSMVGTLYEGDMLLVKKYAYGIPLPRLPWVNWVIFPDFSNNGHLIAGEHPKRGDIVIFVPPHEKKTYYVKRNFAIGGDEILFTKEGLYLHCKEGNDFIKEHYADKKSLEFAGKIFVLNPYMSEHRGIHYAKNNETFYFMQMLASGKIISQDPSMQKISMQPIVLDGELVFYKQIPENEFFMIGDNRDNSNDSRFWGSVPYADIVGKPWVIWLSVNLRNSQEADVINHPKKFFSIRWNRMFKSMHTLESEIK